MARVQKATESRVEMTLASHQPDETTKDETALAAVRNRIIADASLEQFLKEWADGVMQLPALERELERQNRIAVMKPLYGEAERLVDAALADAQGGRSAPLVAREPVDAAELLDELVFLLVDYVAFSALAPVEAVALWVLHTYVYEQFETSPYLAITSAERRSGKTRLLDVLELLVAKPWRVISPTEAVLYRKVERDAPTILFDETDTVFGPKAGSNYEGIRALLNAGHRRGTKVPRCVGEGSKMALHEFEVYCPKALAGIGDLPDTVADRSIPIRMRRRRPGERVERFRMRDVREASEELRAKLAQWGEDAQLDRATPFIPAELNDRAADSWEPLLAVGESAGDRWAAKAREAALALSGGEVAEEDSLGVRLLADCRAVFDSCDEDSLASDALIARLIEREEAPWGDLFGKPITARKLANLLRPYDVRPSHWRSGGGTSRGYQRRAFEDAWSRYLRFEAAQPAQVPICRSFDDSQSGTGSNAVPLQKVPICRDVPLVPLEMALEGGTWATEE